MVSQTWWRGFFGEGFFSEVRKESCNKYCSCVMRPPLTQEYVRAVTNDGAEKQLRIPPPHYRKAVSLMRRTIPTVGHHRASPYGGRGGGLGGGGRSESGEYRTVQRRNRRGPQRQ